MNTIGNNYGAALTPEAVVEMFGSEKAFKESLKYNIGVRAYLCGRGFSRVSRAFADAVIEITK